MRASDKPLVWLRGEVKSPPFSREARIEAGVLLRRLQRGEVLGMPHARPMASIGKSCFELRIIDKDKTWRIIYSIESEAIVILDVFAKKTQKTPAKVIEVCIARLKAYRNA